MPCGHRDLCKLVPFGSENGVRFGNTLVTGGVPIGWDGDKTGVLLGGDAER